MKAVISASNKVITGIFTVRIACLRDFPLSALNVEFVTVSGDALGGEFTVNGGGASHQVVYYPDADVAGVSEVRLVGDLKARPVRIVYDTYQSVVASFGEVRYDNKKVIVPVRFSHAVVGLTKRHFRVEMGRGRYSVYGKDRDYEVHVDTDHPFSVSMKRQVCKSTGILVDVESEGVSWQPQS